MKIDLLLSACNNVKKTVLFFVLLLAGLTGFSQTTTFSYSGSVQNYTVPAGTYSITVDAWGAKGGGANCGGTFGYQSLGGCGGRVQATITVTPGHVLGITVGQKGTNTGAGGYGGGGTDNLYNNTWPGTGGGGATTIVDLTTGATLLIAGGGGGGGGYSCPGGGLVGDAGGAGGGLTGGAGNSSYCGTGSGGRGGTAAAGGAGATCAGYTALSGTAGNGANCTAAAGHGSGAGGGGYYGGGSGAYGGGGGGGSSYTNPSFASAVIHTQGYNCTSSSTGGNGQLIVVATCTPGTVTGANEVCTGTTMSLTDAVAGGTWSSNATAVATVTATGIVTGVSGGTATISYSVGTCYALYNITVTPTPAPISGSAALCPGGVATLTDAIAGGTWVSSNPAVGTINTSGTLTGVSTGTSTISYRKSALCYVTTTVTVNAPPASIAGPSTVCLGSTTSLTETSTGGTWSSSNVAIASIGSSGSPANVTGMGVGIATITYSVAGAGCYVTAPITVVATPGAISGAFGLCSGSSITLTDITIGGTWNSANPGIASIASTSGIVTGVGSGTTTITYTTGCAPDATTVVIVTPLATIISGTPVICAGSGTTLSNGAAGGTWTSSAPGIASVDEVNGLVNGNAAGTATISYTTGCGTPATLVVTVNDQPTAITGTTALCNLSTVTLSDPIGGGAWTSLSPGVANVDASGNVTGVSAGTSIVSYTLGSCGVATVVTVNTQPAPITGTFSFCNLYSIALAEGTGGGTWTSANPGVATIDGVGNVTGISPGTTDISYTIGSCTASQTVTVNIQPAPITGTVSLCNLSSTSLSDVTTGGIWTSTSPGVAIVDGYGNLSGVSPGTSDISYIVGSCAVAQTVTVNIQPAPISGALSFCNLSTTALTDSTGGGTWASESTDVVTVDASGNATGISSGISNISYTIGSCSATQTVTVNIQPEPITGTLSFCNLSTTPLTDVATGGAWVSNNPGVATVDVSGNVTGIAPGTSDISYTIGGCTAMVTVTVNTQPAPINGAASLCNSSGITLSDATSGGIWTSVNPGIATVDVAGNVTGVSPGNATISYTIGSCSASQILTVNIQPVAITGTPGVCVLSIVSLSDVTPGGTWSSVAPGVATVDAFGNVSGLSAGTSLISYSIGSCSATQTLTVDPLPAGITGNLTVCVGYTTALSDITSGGAWSANNGNATITTTSGIVSGNTAGTDMITYTLPTGCIATEVVTVNSLPGGISGILTVCSGSTTSLSDGTGGGTWSTSSPGTASVSGSGVVTGGTAGTATITYAIGNGCYVTTVVTVNLLPANIAGTMTLCSGSTTSLTNAASGGSWSSSTPGNASVSSIGVVTGGTAGTATITYALPTGCLITTVVTVNPLPAPILGTLNVCAGLTTSLTDATPGGTWSSSTPIVATISATGIVTGASAGTTIDTYTLPTGCIATAAVTVNPLPAPVTGVMTVCSGSTTTLTDAVGGGTWTSGAPAVALVSGTGVVTGGTAGLATITYTLPTGCVTTTPITINPLPSAISGTLSVCSGSITSLTDVGGGTWNVSNTNAVISSTGMVTGVAAGTDIVTYTLPTGCVTTGVVTVNPLPAGITGSLTVCSGLTTSVSDLTPGGAWSSSVTGIANITAAGTVTGGTPGTATITYSLPTGCIATTIITINSLPAGITGNLTVCLGLTTALTDLTTGGTWGSSNANATVGSTGTVTGLVAGTSIITYSLPTGCITTSVVTVNSLPVAISGVGTLCSGLTTSLSDSPGGGTWSSSTPSVASIGSLTGMVTGGIAGTATITYMIGSGCTMITIVTVNPLPAPIAGASSVCVGLMASLSDPSPGGNWSSSNPGAGPISATGIVSGITAGTTIITYTLPTSCITISVVTVNPLPPAISGTLVLCSGLTTSLSDAGSGTWASSPPGTASVSAAGVVTGGVAGTAVVTYTLPTSCIATTILTVNPLPAAISGVMAVCPGSTSLLSDINAGGIWTSGIPALATVGSGTGIVSGISAGTTAITYTLPTGCITTATVTINPLPAAISGTQAVCQGLTTSLSDATTGGTWSSSAPGIASVSAGLVTGLLAGSAIISYTLPTSCAVTATVTVNPLPAAIVGAFNLCSGLTTTLSDPTYGGTWTSGASATASAGLLTGIITGGTPGTATITYTLPSSCIATAIVTIEPLPGAIMGDNSVCVGLSTLLSDVTTGGTWSSSNGNSSVAPGSGLVTGITGGTSIITYTLPTGCITTAIVTINSLPAAIAGTQQVCIGLATDLSDVTPGGTWSSSNINTTIGLTTGIATGITTGTSVITYTLPTTCITTAVLTVDPLPAAITGTLNVCTGLTTTLTDTSAGGTWSSGNMLIAVVAPSTGVVTGVAAGSANITYALPTGCIEVTTITVNPLPAAISGPEQICFGTTTHLEDITAGGIWTSSNTAVAPVTATGVVSGIGAGTAAVSYTLSAGCSAIAVITVSPLPNVYAVTQTDTSYCAGGSGVHIGLSGSNTGISYLLYYGVSATGYLIGNGSPLDFGLLTVAGTYTVHATDPSSGCTSDMTGSAHVVITPTVSPTVAISAAPGFTVCPGTSILLTPTPTYGGTLPSYKWSVNGTVVSLSNTYSFIPADGDIVNVTMTSNYTCAVPATVDLSETTTVPPYGLPAVALNIDPGDTVCEFSAATFTATPTFGGSAPLYAWYVNAVQEGTGSVFSYDPNSGDQVYCKLISDYQCRLADTANSNAAVMTVTPLVIPHIAILSSTGFNELEGQTDSLWTVVYDAGPDPSYQWKVNGVPILGDTLSYLVRHFNNRDSVTCVVNSSGVCHDVSSFDWAYITVVPLSVQEYSSMPDDIRLIPNPNNGMFAIKGSIANRTNDEVTIEVTDMLGQIVYTAQAKTKSGSIDKNIQLSNTLANGMYILNLSCGNYNRVFHFMVRQ